MIVNTLRVLRLKLLCKEVGRGCLLDKDITVVHGEYVSIGSGCTIHKDTLLHVAAKNKDAKEPILKIGSNCHLSFRTWIAARIGITIGDDTGFAPGVVIQDYNHGYTDITKPVHLQPLVEERPITIGKGCFLAANVVVTPGVTIGDGVVIGANSVVTSDIPSYSLAVGCPAKVVKRHNPQTGQWERVR